MRIQERNSRAFTMARRRTLRRLPVWLLEEAYAQLKRGYSDWFVCATLGVSPDIIDVSLEQALEEALWERGRAETA
jgi:hypothetical protein